MANDPRQVAVLVRAMLAKYGHKAPKAAADRVRMWKRMGDQQTAGLWSEVVEAAAMMTRGNGRQGRKH